MAFTHSSSSLPSPSSFRVALQAFTASSSSFQILHTCCSQHISRPRPARPVTTLHILDSSFNPPTQAHRRIAISALVNNPSGPPCLSTKRLLLLLATHNADKPAQPASFEQRLVMMGLLAEDIVRDVDEGSRIDGGGDEEEHVVYVDVGVTTKPYFLDKAVAIEESGCYISEATGKGPEQVHLIGFDTLLRLLDPKYYPDRTLTPLEPFWDKCRVRVTKRIGDLWGGTDRQEAYVRALADGMREEEGGRREWAGRIELVEGTPEREGTVSSTKVREAVRQHDHDTFNKLVTEGVKRHILDNHLYVDEDA